MLRTLLLCIYHYTTSDIIIYFHLAEFITFVLRRSMPVRLRFSSSHPLALAQNIHNNDLVSSSSCYETCLMTRK